MSRGYYSTNHDIDQYLGLGDLSGIDCESVQQSCLEKWPDDGGPSNSPVNRGLVSCLENAGYYIRDNGCYYERSYDNPGATTYPVDVLFNSDNPNFVWKSPVTWAVIAGAGALLLLAMSKR